VTRPEAAAATPPDEELVNGWRRGDEGAAAILVRRHTGSLARFLSAAGARDDVEDLVQETFFRAFRRIDTFRGDATFLAWVLAIGSNVLKDHRRRGARRLPIAVEEGKEVADHGSDPANEAAERDLLAQLEVAVAALPPMQRDVFLLRAQQGFDYEGIARALHTTVGAARVHYHHAVKRLKRVIM
jgi:RNA polymerase sigma-70 factor (ECF subfamily)